MLSTRYMNIRPCPRLISASGFGSFSRSLSSSQIYQATVPSRIEVKGVSNVRNKLNYFIETGQIIRKTPSQFERKRSQLDKRRSIESAKNIYSAQKALLVLKAKYDNKLQVAGEGEIIDVFKLNAKDLNITSPKSLQIFDSLVELKKINKKPIDRKLLLLLLGSSIQQLKDPFLVTEDTLKLLERDKSDTRACYLARLAGDTGIVAMNSILQWHLDRGDVKNAFRSFNDRKKWKIPENDHSYVILFSGLAKCHEWGKVPDHLAESCIEIFQDFRAKSANDETSKLTCSVLHFNACLSLVAKNYSNNQQFAWSFFDELIPDPTKSVPVLVADGQTFTILLNGIKKFHQHQAELIQDDRNLTSNEKTRKLVENQNNLITTAKLILSKVIAAATPPVPPTKEEAKENPELLVEYRKKMKRIIIDIDPVFATTFVTCFINNTSGTSTHFGGGSHYKFIQQGLKYLTAWCPEVESMFHFIEKAGQQITEPSDEVKRRTDTRISKASAESLLSIESVDREVVNPLVQFPPPPLSKNKTKALFSGKKKRLVDFTRPSLADVRLFLQNKQYNATRGKYGAKIPAGKNVTLEKRNGINKFLVMTALDGLISLGKHKEFYIGVWYVLTKWGGIYASRTDIIKAIETRGLSGVLDNVYFVKYQDLKKQELSKETQPDSGFNEVTLSQKLSVTPPHNPEVVDVMLVENFIYKIHENFDGKLPPSTLINEILTVMLNPDYNMSQTLKPRDKTMTILFSVLMKELFHFNDSNYNRGIISTRVSNVPNNTPKKSITKQQLSRFLPSLIRAINNVIVYDHQVFKGVRKAVLANYYTESYNKLVERLYNSTWIDVEKGSKEYIYFHKLIVKSGIFMYKPTSLVDPRQNVVYSTPIHRSMVVVYDSLKDRKDLDRNETKLMVNLRDIFTLKSGTKDGNEVLAAYARKVYNNIIV